MNRSELEFAEAILAQPVRMCGMRHENVMRGADGEALYQPGTLRPEYVPECPQDLKHLGCPHFQQVLGEEFFRALRSMDDGAKELGELHRIQRRQASLDGHVRYARMGTEAEIRVQKILDIDTGELNAAPFLAEFNENCRRIEELRVILLEKVRGAISRLRAPELEGGVETA